MKILISALHTDSNISGVGYYSINLIKELSKLNVDFHLYVLINNHLKGKIEESTNVKLLIIDHGDSLAGRIKKHVFHVFGIRKYVRKFNVDVVHILNPILFFKLPVPTVTTVHDLAELHLKKYNIARQSYRIWTAFLSCFLSSKIIAISENSKQDIVKFFHIRPSKIDVIHQSFGVLPRITNNEANSHPRYLLFVGKALPHKNLSLLLTAFNNIVSRKGAEEIILIVVGKGNEKLVSKLFNQNAEMKERITIKGYVSDEELQVLYNNAYGFVMPSIYEGFGLPLIEAMSYNLPILCARASCFPEITDNKVLYHDPYDVEDLEKALIKLIGDQELRTRMVNEYPGILAKYSWKTTAERTFQTYQSITLIKVE